MNPSVKKFLLNACGSFLGSFFGTLLAVAIALVAIPAVLIMIVSGQRYTATEPIKPKSILHLDISGTIKEKRSPIGFDFARGLRFQDPSVGLFEMSRAIDVAKEDKRIAGIYMTIRDFDAGWATVTALRRKLSEFVATGKWIYVYADRLNEMGYYLASVGSQIFLQPHGEIEFNGLAAHETFFKGLADKLEVEPIVFRAGRFKSAVEPFTNERMSEENREQLSALIGDIWKEVLAAAASVANTDASRIDEMATTLQIVSAQSAKDAGIVHETAFVDVVEDRMLALTVGKDEELPLVSPGRLLREAASKRKRAKKKIAVIFAQGEIHSGSGRTDSIGSEDLRDEIKAAREDEDTVAIVLRVNSPGGDALASDVIWRELRMSDEEIPVVVSLGDVAASGGYYIASAGRYVFAEPTTITGSIGVFGLMFNAENFFKNKTGISFDRAVTNPRADMGTFTRAITPVETRVIQEEVDRVYKRFLDVVQESRGYEERKDLEEIAEGRVWSGVRARELGLVDELGGLDQAINKAAEYANVKEYLIEIFPNEADSLRMLFERFADEVSVGVFGSGAQELKAVRSLLDDRKLKIRARLPFDLKVQ